METPVQKGIPALYRKRALLWFSFLLLKRKSAASVGLWRCPSCLPHGGKDFIDGLGGEVIFFRQFVHGSAAEMFLVQLPVPGEPLPAGVRSLAPSPFPFRLARNIEIHPVRLLLDRVQQVAGKYPVGVGIAHYLAHSLHEFSCEDEQRPPASIFSSSRSSLCYGRAVSSAFVNPFVIQRILKRAHGMRGRFAAVGCGGCWNKECTSWFPYVRARLPLRTDLIRSASAFSDGAGTRGRVRMPPFPS